MHIVHNCLTTKFQNINWSGHLNEIFLQDFKLRSKQGKQGMPWERDRNGKANCLSTQDFPITRQTFKSGYVSKNWFDVQAGKVEDVVE